VQSLLVVQQPVSGACVHIPPAVGQSSSVQRLPSSHSALVVQHAAIGA